MPVKRAAILFIAAAMTSSAANGICFILDYISVNKSLIISGALCVVYVFVGICYVRRIL